MKKIMIIDDEDDLREMICQNLKIDGYEVVGVKNGFECFKILTNDEHELPDLILLDIMMPGLNGWEVVKKLKEIPEWKKIPVIFITVKTDNFNKAFGKILAQGYIEKPFDIQKLQEKIESFLEKPVKISENKEKIVDEMLDKFIKTDEEGIQLTKHSKVMIVDDEDDLREMISIMMEKEGCKIEVANNGEDFLDKVEKFNPDIVTLDVMMPGLTTIEIFEKLKNKKCKPKIIMLTVMRYDEEEKKELFKMANVVDYITKPFDVSDFMDSIRKHME